MRTRLQLKTYAIREVHGGNPNETAVARIEEALEGLLDRIAMERHWGCHETVFEFVTVAPYGDEDPAVTASVSGTSVTGQGTTFPAEEAIVGQRIEFNNERHWYEVTERGGDTALTILNAYSNPAATSLTEKPFLVLFPLYDLPANYAIISPDTPCLYDVDAGADSHPYTTQGLMSVLHAQGRGSGRLECFGVQSKRTNPEQKQLFLYPAPSGTRRYQLTYFRRPGWWNAAADTWKPTATLDTDLIDWPRESDAVLNAGVEAFVAKSIKPDKFELLNRHFEFLLGKAASMDRKRPGLMRLGRRKLRLQGTYYKWGS